MGMAIAPLSPVQGHPDDRPQAVFANQSLQVDSFGSGSGKDVFSAAEAPKPEPVAAASSGWGAPAAGVPDPGTAQDIAYGMLASWGWDSETEWSCLFALWGRESGWNVYAHNSSSGAYGIPQALPGEKMASAGEDWATNPATQITWGFGYIAGRYGSPCGAWESSQTRGWY